MSDIARHTYHTTTKHPLTRATCKLARARELPSNDNECQLQFPFYHTSPHLSLRLVYMFEDPNISRNINHGVTSRDIT